MASSTVSNRCAGENECKKTAIIKCDGCSLRFCSNHFPMHRQQLEAQLELICADRDLFHYECSQQVNNPTEQLKEIDQWEQQTLAHVKKTADKARQRIRELSVANISNEKFEQLSKELRTRKDAEDFFEHDIERLKEQLNKIKIESKLRSKLDISYMSIDWQAIIQIKPAKQEQTSEQFFKDTHLLNLKHQKILNQFCEKPNQQWQLIYRGTQHGFKEGNFIHRCAGQGPTIALILVGTYLFGGYTSVSWKCSKETVWDRDPSAFLFTLINPHQIPPTKYPIKPPGHNAIRSDGDFGPTFGLFDICIHSNGNISTFSNTGFPKNYCDTTNMGTRTFTGGHNFRISEIEVYKQVSFEP